MSATAFAMSFVTVPVFGFGIKPPRSQDPSGLPDRRHHVRRGDRRVEVDLALHDVVHELLTTDDVGACLARLARLVALSEHGHPHRPAGAVGQRDGATEGLVLLPRVEAEPERDLDGLIEPGVGQIPSGS